MADTVMKSAEEIVSSASDLSSSAYRSTAEQANHTMRQAARMSRRARNELGELVGTHPLLFGAVCLRSAQRLAVRFGPAEVKDRLWDPASDGLKKRGSGWPRRIVFPARGEEPHRLAPWGGSPYWLTILTGAEAEVPRLAARGN